MVVANRSQETFNGKARIQKESDKQQDFPIPSKDYYKCNKKTSFAQTIYKEKNEEPCWFERETRENVLFLSKDVQKTLEHALWFSSLVSRVLWIMATLFSICAIICAIRIYKSHRVTRLWLKLTGVFRLGRDETSGPGASGSGSSPSYRAVHVPLQPTTRITRPTTEGTSRKISALVSETEVSEAEVRLMIASGWSCCICLDSEPGSGHLRSVSRLKCGHATHSECLQVWLQKGRAVCCLCNADVFPKPKHGRPSHVESASGSEAMSADSEPGYINSVEPSRESSAVEDLSQEASQDYSGPNSADR